MTESMHGRTCTVAAEVARMTDPTTSPGTTSNTLCALWHVIVQMPAQPYRGHQPHDHHLWGPVPQRESLACPAIDVVSIRTD
jgi:hypothetical protein